MPVQVGSVTHPSMGSKFARVPQSQPGMIAMHWIGELQFRCPQAVGSHAPPVSSQSGLSGSTHSPGWSGRMHNASGGQMRAP